MMLVSGTCPLREPMPASFAVARLFSVPSTVTPPPAKQSAGSLSRDCRAARQGPSAMRPCEPLPVMHTASRNTLDRPRRRLLEPAVELTDGDELPPASPHPADLVGEVLVEEVAGDADRRRGLVGRERES